MRHRNNKGELSTKRLVYIRHKTESFFNNIGSVIPSNSQRQEYFEKIVDNLNSTKDGKASKEAHGATDKTKRGLQGYLFHVENNHKMTNFDSNIITLISSPSHPSLSHHRWLCQSRSASLEMNCQQMSLKY